MSRCIDSSSCLTGNKHFDEQNARSFRYSGYRALALARWSAAAPQRAPSRAIGELA